MQIKSNYRKKNAKKKEIINAQKLHMQKRNAKLIEIKKYILYTVNSKTQMPKMLLDTCMIHI